MSCHVLRGMIRLKDISKVNQKMKIQNVLLAGVLMYSSFALSADTQTQLVTKEQALQLAENYVIQHYGNQTAQAQKPYQIKREGEYWIITGNPPKVLGGNFLVVLGEKGKLEKITHTKQKDFYDISPKIDHFLYKNLHIFKFFVKKFRNLYIYLHNSSFTLINCNFK